MPQTGFGSLPGVYGNQGVDPTPPANDATMAADIKAMKEKYVDGDVEYQQVFNLGTTGSPGTFSQRLDFTQTPFNTVIIAVQSGNLNFFFGDYSGDVTAIPHVPVAAGQAPQYMLRTAGRVLTITNPSAVQNCTGCLTVMKI